MTTKTCITEGIVGVISAWVFLWLFPLASSMESMVSSYYATNISNTPTIISTATLVFSISLFGIVAIYCLGTCLEKLIFYVYDYRIEIKSLIARKQE
jgi:hypothetical protein